MDWEEGGGRRGGEERRVCGKVLFFRGATRRVDEQRTLRRVKLGSRLQYRTSLTLHAGLVSRLGRRASRVSNTELRTSSANMTPR